MLLLGSEAISTVVHFAAADPAGRPDFTEHADGSLEDRGYGLEGMMPASLTAHGLAGAPSLYALFENARRARLRQTRGECAAAMGALFAPFTAVAAANPHSSAPVERGAAELVTPTKAWQQDNSKKLQAEVDGWAAPEEAGQADGQAVIETYTITYGRNGSRAGIVVGRLDADGRRFVARAEAALLDLLTTGEPVGSGCTAARRNRSTR